VTVKQSIDTAMARSGIKSKEDLAKRAAIDRATFWRRMGNPGGFKLSEIQRMDMILHFSDEEIVGMVRTGRR